MKWNKNLLVWRTAAQASGVNNDLKHSSSFSTTASVTALLTSTGITVNSSSSIFFSKSIIRDDFWDPIIHDRNTNGKWNNNYWLKKKLKIFVLTLLIFEKWFLKENFGGFFVLQKISLSIFPRATSVALLER
jgi:hypothetical protein